MGHYFGYKPDKPDTRDFIYKPTLAVEKLPTMVDLRKTCSPVRDQGQLGSCTWQSMVGFREFQERLTDDKFIPLSVLFGYYNTRVDEGTEDEDSGCYLRDCWKQLQKVGTCANKYWPYDISVFDEKPSDEAYASSIWKITTYHRLNTLTDVKTHLVEGLPVVIGFTVYESFENIGSDGVMPMPTAWESVLGGHAVVVVGYDDSKKWFIVRNSWGNSWGDAGYFYMPYEFVTPNDVSDMWAAV